MIPIVNVLITTMRNSGGGGLQSICKVSAHTTSVAWLHNCLTWWQVAKARDTICCPLDCPWQNEWESTTTTEHPPHFQSQICNCYRQQMWLVLLIFTFSISTFIISGCTMYISAWWLNHYLNVGSNLWCHRRLRTRCIGCVWQFVSNSTFSHRF